MVRATPVVLFLVVPALLSVNEAARGQSPAQPMPVAGPSYSQTLVGTVGGGLLGATLVGGTLGLVGLASEDGGELVSPAALGLLYGGVIGYWLGQAVGGSWGSATDAHRLSRRRLLWPAALWTSAGLVVAGVIGNSFEVENSTGTDKSWYVGGAVGTLVQVVGMSVTTHRTALNESRAASLVSLRFYPSPDHQLTAALQLRLGHPF
jgi:hypothetical protein